MNTTNTQDLVFKALDRAFVMGQNYWADADSESWTANKRSDVTREKFRAMRDEVCAALQPAAAQPQGDVVVSWNEARTRIVGVTRQDEEGRILKVIAEAPAQPQGDAQEAFEAWAQKEGYVCSWLDAGKYHDAGYIDERTTCAWEGWQAARTQGFTAHDMATAAADGFRDGVASTQASEPSATMSDANRLVAYSAAATLRSIGYEWDDTEKKWQAAPARAVEPLTYNEIKQMGSEWLNNGTTDHFDLMQQAIEAFCKKNGITITPTQAAQGDEA